MSRVAIVVVLVAAACTKSTPNPLGTDTAQLPCDVRDVLVNACTQCHTSPPNSASKVPLESRDDFLADSISIDGETVGEVAAARLHDADNPMPPVTEPPLTRAQLATLDAWLATSDLAPGTSACDPIPSPPAATSCPSGTTWTMGTTGNADMTPGEACKTCHERDAPTANYAFQGTVFSDYHTADDCDAVPPTGARIEILDQDGAVTRTLVPGLSGNFTSFDVDDPHQAPYRARVVANGLAREMSATHTSTDCNACHTEQGKNAFADTNPTDPVPPGRIVWPSRPAD